jgi:hypothetical protein
MAGWLIEALYMREPGNEGHASDLVCVLLRKQGEKWKIVIYSIGPTDVVYEDWDRKYKAPPDIFKE